MQNIYKLLQQLGVIEQQEDIELVDMQLLEAEKTAKQQLEIDLRALDEHIHSLNDSHPSLVKKLQDLKEKVNSLKVNPNSDMKYEELSVVVKKTSELVKPVINNKIENDVEYAVLQNEYTGLASQCKAKAKSKRLGIIMDAIQRCVCAVLAIAATASAIITANPLPAMAAVGAGFATVFGADKALTRTKGAINLNSLSNTMTEIDAEVKIVAPKSMQIN